MEEKSLKQRTAGTLKWNMIDRVSTQVLYTVTGVVLARMLSQEDFGLVGAVMVFQTFAGILVDGGFSYALIQRKRPTQLDFSTVLWFNMGVAAVLYALAWVCAPLIAACFGGDPRLVPLTRISFLILLLDSSSLIQYIRLNKRMDTRMIAVANALGLTAGALVGITLALQGAGAWAVVWQGITVSTVKSLTLWVSERWRPQMAFSWPALRSYMGVGTRMLLTSFLNKLFLNIYSFLVGNRVGLVALGYYTQGDKWSKMGITSLSQVLTSSFLPALSAVQDDLERFRRLAARMNRFAAYLLFPATLGLAALAAPAFHTLFGTKWDPAIALFQMLLVRGIFTVLCSLYNNYLLALGHARAIVWLEVLRDGAAIIALAATLPVMAYATPSDPVAGLRYMLWGQIAASALTWIVSVAVVARAMHTGIWRLILDLAPYCALTLAIVPVMTAVGSLMPTDFGTLMVEAVMAIAIYLAVNRLAGSRIQAEILAYFTKKKL